MAGWVITRYEDVRNSMRDPRYSANPAAVFHAHGTAAPRAPRLDLTADAGPMICRRPRRSTGGVSPRLPPSLAMNRIGVKAGPSPFTRQNSCCPCVAVSLQGRPVPFVECSALSPLPRSHAAALPRASIRQRCGFIELLGGHADCVLGQLIDEQVNFAVVATVQESAPSLALVSKEQTQGLQVSLPVSSADARWTARADQNWQGVDGTGGISYCA